MSPITTNTNVKVKTASGLSKLVRPKFAPGMLLQHDDLEQATAYTRDLSRLLFRSFFGCGVVCGLCVTREENCGKVQIVVAPGLALDCGGDPIYVPKRTPVTIDEECNQTLTGPLWVLLCSTVKCCSPRTSSCGCDDDDEPAPVCTRERDAFEIQVFEGKEPPKCACWCPGEHKGTTMAPAPNPAGQVPKERDCQCVDPNDDCYKLYYRGECGCNDDEASEGCCCKCVVLAKIEYTKKEQDKEKTWSVNHRVRRFIRPVLMRDTGCPEPPAPKPAEQDTDKAKDTTQNPDIAQSVKTAKGVKVKK